MKSMTGYGSSERIVAGEKLSVELKSLNNRYIDFKIRHPREYNVFETQIMAIVKKIFRRGYIEINIQREAVGGKRPPRYVFNNELAEYYIKTLKVAQKKLKLSGQPTMDQVLSLPDVWGPLKRAKSEQSQWTILKGILQESLRKLDYTRSQEGKALSDVIFKYLVQFERELSLLTQHKQRLVKDFHLKLKKRMAVLLDNSRLDQNRLNQEVAYIVDRSDVSEELDRLKSHLTQFRKLLKTQGPIGKQLDFMIQEMNRETNTIGSKIQNTKLTSHIIACKSLLERIREQIQNVE